MVSIVIIYINILVYILQFLFNKQYTKTSKLVLVKKYNKHFLSM